MAIEIRYRPDPLRRIQREVGALIRRFVPDLRIFDPRLRKPKHQGGRRTGYTISKLPS